MISLQIIGFSLRSSGSARLERFCKARTKPGGARWRVAFTAFRLRVTFVRVCGSPATSTLGYPSRRRSDGDDVATARRLQFEFHVSNLTSTLLRRSLAVASVLVAVSGCYAEATTGADVEYADPIANVEVYPHEYYEGHVVYLVGDRWYYQAGPRWVYYRTEPQPLYQRRVVYSRQPVVVHERAEVHRAPPAPPRYETEPVRTAPPAHVERHEYREYRE
jgi:hypothetical protein